MTHSGAPPGTRVVHGAITDTGQVRAHNEDAFGIDAEHRVFVVADGLGGHRAGEVASAAAVERFLDVMADTSPREPGPFDVLTSAIDAAHRAVQHATEEAPGREGMGTTIVAVWFPDPGTMAWLVNVGDSRGFLFRSRLLTQLSADDTALEELRRARLLPRDPALWPPRQQLTQALGPSEHVEPHISGFALDPGDQVLLCSDGLTDMVPEEEMAHIMAAAADPQAACEALVVKANRGGGLDNITVVVAKVGGGDVSGGPA